MFVVAGDCHPQTIEVIQTAPRRWAWKCAMANSAEDGTAMLDDDYFAALSNTPSHQRLAGRPGADVDAIQTKGAAFIVAPTCWR